MSYANKYYQEYRESPIVRAAGLKTPTSLKVVDVIVERTVLAAARVRGKS